MRDRIIAIVLIATVALPAAAGAQDAPAPEAAGAQDGGLLARLCSADVTDEASLAACLVTVAASLAGAASGAVPDPRPSAAPHDLLGQARQVVDETLASARAAGQQVDLQAVVDEALAAAQDVDLQAVLDEALAAVGDVDAQALLDGGLGTTREVIAAAQAWIVENSDTVCKGGSLSVGTSAAAVVAYLTGSPGLAIRAFEETERLSSDICEDVAQ